MGGGNSSTWGGVQGVILGAFQGLLGGNPNPKTGILVKVGCLDPKSGSVCVFTGVIQLKRDMY